MRPGELRRAAAGEEVVVERDVPGIEGTTRVLARSGWRTGGGRRPVPRRPRRDARQPRRVVRDRRSDRRAARLAARLRARRGRLRPVEAMRRVREEVSLAGGARAASAAGGARRDPPARRDAQRDARPAAPVVRARAALRGRREPRAAHAGGGHQGRARGRCGAPADTILRCARRSWRSLEECDHLGSSPRTSSSSRARRGRAAVQARAGRRARAPRAHPAALRRPRG